MELIAGLLIGAALFYYLSTRNDELQQGLSNGKKDFGRESAEVRHKMFIKAQGRFQRSRFSDPIVLSYSLLNKEIVLIRVVCLVDNSGTTILFDQTEHFLTFEEFQSLLKSFASFPGSSFEEAVKRTDVLKASCSFLLHNEHVSIECYFFAKE